MLLRFTGARYPECNGVSCPDGKLCTSLFLFELEAAKLKD